MGIPSPLGVSASGLPAKGDVANAVLSGTFSGVGPSAPFAFIGPMNFSIYASLVDTLTTTAGSLSATVATGTGIAAGDAINSTLVPLGTTLGALSGTTATLALAPITLMGSTQGFYPGAPGVINGLYQTNGLLGATVTGPNISANTTVTKIIQPYIGDGTFPVRGFKQLGIVQIEALTVQQAFRAEVLLYIIGGGGKSATWAGGDRAPEERIGAVHQGESREDCLRLSEREMNAGDIAPLRRVIHAGQIVEDEGCGVEVLERNCKIAGLLLCEAVGHRGAHGETRPGQASRVFEEMLQCLAQARIDVRRQGHLLQQHRLELRTRGRVGDSRAGWFQNRTFHRTFERWQEMLSCFLGRVTTRSE